MGKSVCLYDTFHDIRKKLKKNLDHNRYVHTLGVASTAQALAMRYGEDLDRSYLAGLLHDCAKNIPNSERIGLCEKWGIPVSDTERLNTTLLHGKMGAYLAKTDYGITDPEILSSIALHTTGKPGMSLLEKIIYTADYIEPNRDQAANLTEIRRTAFTDLDKAVYLICRDTLDYVKHQSGSILDPESLEVLKYYVKYNTEEENE